MNSNLVYSIHLNEHHDYKSLYDWCLEEHDSDGMVGHAYPPFCWTVWFTAKIVSNINVLSCDSDANDFYKMMPQSKNGISEVDLVCSTKPFITAKLHPGFIDCETKKLMYFKRFQILGTKDEIKEFFLEIHPLSELKNIRSEGSVKKSGFMICHPKEESGAGFNQKIRQSLLRFILYIELKDFDNLSQLIATGSLSNLHFSATNVDGLYARWDPDAEFSRDIRVLPNNQTDYRVVKNGEEIPFTKRAMKLSNYNLRYVTSRKMDAMQIIDTDNNI